METISPLIGTKLAYDTHPSLQEQGTIPYMLNGDIQGYKAGGQGVFAQNLPGNKETIKLGEKYLGHVKLSNDRILNFYSPGRITVVTDNHERELVYAPCLDLKKEIQGRYHFVNGDEIVYFIEEDGPIRKLNITCLPKKRTSDCDTCPEQVLDEIDCDALLLNSSIPQPCLDLSYLDGGNIPNGVYQIAIAYVQDNERVSDYIIFPNVIKPFNSFGGNFSINTTLSCYTSPYEEYELVLITHRVDRGTQAQVIGRFDTANESVTISSLDEAYYKPIELEVLFNTTPKYISADHIAVNNQSLVLAGVKERKKLDAQLIANNITSKWQTYAIRPQDAHLFPSFNRWEVYSFFISWVFRDGQESRRYLISNNVNKPIDSVPNDVNHFEQSSPACEESLKEYWELYDNSTLDFYNPSDTVCEKPVLVAEGNFSYWESKDITYDETFGDWQCEKVRYHRFPKHTTHGDATALTVKDNCEEPTIHIFGVSFSNIQTPLFCDGKPADIVGYKIYAKDRVGQESVLSSGLLFNTRYEELPNGEQSMFQNYPFNELPTPLRPDQYLAKDRKAQGNIFDADSLLTTYHKDRFNYYSPDLQYIKGGRGTEIETMFQAVGNISGEFHETNGMPKYQILSSLGRLAAQIAGILEAKEVLEGKPCTTTIREEECITRVERTTNVMDFPVSEITTSSNPFNVNLASVAGPVTGVVTGPVTDISSMVTQHNYSYTTDGDDGCTTSYNVTSVNVIDNVNPIGDITSAPDTCRLEIETNAPKGVIVTLTLNGNEYNVIVDENGRGTIQLFNDCYPLNTDVPFAPNWTATNVNAKFYPECECAGDTVVRTRLETETCDTKIKFLSNLSFNERLPAMLYYYSQARESVGAFLESITSPTNYGLQYTATATYDNYIISPYQRRRVDFQQYLTSSKVFVNGNRFNNRFQAPCDYIELHSTLADNTGDLSRVLHSEVGCAKEFSCATIEGVPIQAVSYYTQLRRQMPNQYGSPADGLVRQLTCVLTGTESGGILGGDVYITKHRVVRKFPLFNQLPLDQINNTEFNYSDYPHVAHPRFWMDINKESALEDIVEDLPLVGNLFQDYNLDDVAKPGQCFGTLDNQNWLDLLAGPGYLINWVASLITDGWTNPFKLSGMFYTHVTGVVDYWAESRFIANNREYNELKETQYHVISPEEIADARRYNNPEVSLYNLQYLWQGLTKQTLEQSSQECCELIDRLVYSLSQQNSDKKDRWDMFLANNYTSLPSHTGKLVTVKEIDQYNLFIGFEDAVWVTQQDEGLLTDNFNQVYIGTADAYSRRLRRLSDDTTGFGGIQDRDSVCVTRYGTFWYDRKRAKFLLYTNQLADVTGDMQSWINEYGKEEVKCVYDNYSDNIYVSFKDKGLVYKPKIGSFVSYLDWGVDGFIQLSDNFISIKNKSYWKHNQNRHQEFFGSLRKFEVGAIIKEKMTQGIWQSVDIYAEFYDTDKGNKFYRDEFFTEMIAFNQRYSTTTLPIVLKNPNNVLIDNRYDRCYVSQVEDFTYRLNSLFINSTQQPVIHNIDGVRYEDGEINIQEGRPLQGKYIELRLSKKTDTKVIVQLFRNNFTMTNNP